MSISAEVTLFSKSYETSSDVSFIDTNVDRVINSFCEGQVYKYNDEINIENVEKVVFVSDTSK